MSIRLLVQTKVVALIGDMPVSGLVGVDVASATEYIVAVAVTLILVDKLFLLRRRKNGRMVNVEYSLISWCL
jgi:hypothetical protein